MKTPSSENAHVFCISLNGVVEGHYFLTLVSSYHPYSRRSNTVSHKRARTFSLPPSFEKYGELNDESSKGFVKLSPSDRSLSDDILRISRKRQQSKMKCIDCVTGFNLHDSEIKKKSRTTEFIARKLKRKNIGERKKINVISSKACMHKSLIAKKKVDSVTPCSGLSFQMDGYMLSYFIAEMKRSLSFRTSFLRCWSKDNNRIQLEGYSLLVLVAHLKEPEHEVLDLLGNKMVNSNILFRRSLEHALSWLSTLGGAFSALGDLSPTWAEEAGHVSLTQLRIAMKLGDPGIQSRCRLYAAISLLQRGYHKSCRDIVRNEYQYAMSLPEGSDPRLRRMCLGVWAKLQYHWNQQAKKDKRKLKATLQDGLKDIQNNAKYRNVYDLEEGRKIASA